MSFNKAAPPNGDKLSGGACRPRSRLGGGRTRRPGSVVDRRPDHGKWQSPHGPMSWSDTSNL